jgi:hypothetical protein
MTLELQPGIQHSYNISLPLAVIVNGSLGKKALRSLWRHFRERQRPSRHDFLDLKLLALIDVTLGAV